MPQMANIVVKKNDGVADATYTAMIPSAGDKSAAVWRNNSVGTAPAFRPEFQLLSQSNGPKTARRVTSKFLYPSLATGSDGKVNVVDKVIIELSAVIPQGMSDSDVAEAVSQGVNLCSSILVKDSLKSGYAPT